MNVVFVSHYPSQGGANSEMALLVDKMIKNGYQVYVVMPEKGWLYDRLSSSCECIVCPYHRWVEPKNKKVSIVRKIAKLAVNWKAALFLWKYFRNKNIDIVHTNDSITVVGAYLAFMLKVKHVWHMREIFDSLLNFKHTFSERYCRKWMLRAEAIVAISDAVQERYNLYGGLNIVKIYDGVEVRHKYRMHKINKKVEFLFCGGTHEQKGFPDVLELAKRLSLKGIDYHITIVSSYTIDEVLGIEIEKFGLQNNLEFLGFVNNMDEIRDRCDILLMCSVGEAFGLVTVEAMLAGLLVIGKNSGGTPELIHNGVTGYLYNDIDELERCAIKAISTDFIFITQNAYNYAINNFTIDASASKVIQLYEDLVGQ